MLFSVVSDFSLTRSTPLALFRAQCVKMEFFEHNATVYAIVVLTSGDLPLWRLEANGQWAVSGSQLATGAGVTATSLFRCNIDPTSTELCLIAVGSGGVKVFSLEDPSAPTQIGVAASLQAGTTPRDVAVWMSGRSSHAVVASYGSPSPFAWWRGSSASRQDPFAVLGFTGSYAATATVFFERVFGGQFVLLLQDTGPAYLYQLSPLPY
jgi:hypothetical protein